MLISQSEDEPSIIYYAHEKGRTSQEVKLEALILF